MIKRPQFILGKRIVLRGKRVKQIICGFVFLVLQRCECSFDGFGVRIGLTGFKAGARFIGSCVGSGYVLGFFNA